MGPLPCFPSLKFTIKQSMATGIADHILPLGDLLSNRLSTNFFAHSVKRADFRPERTYFKPGRADFRPERLDGEGQTSGWTNGWMNRQIEVPCVLQDFSSF